MSRLLVKVLKATAIFCALEATIGCASSGDVLANAPDTEDHRNITYRSVEDIDLKLDVYRPSSTSFKTPHPVIVYFHGGAWARGSKPESRRSFNHILNSGYSVVAVQYRLEGQAKAPAAVQDARCAIHWIARNADTYNFDTDRIVTYGTSAGGHLALMAAFLPEDNDIDAPECQGGPKVAAVLDFYGPTDLTPVDPKTGKRWSSVDRWIGERSDGDKMASMMSPVTYVQPTSPPTFMVHGDADQVVPVKASEELFHLMNNQGATVELHIVPGGGHGKFSAPEKKAIFDRAMKFLAKSVGEE